MKAIETKFIGATDRRGSRVIATDGDGNRVTIDYPHELSGEAVHRAAADTLCQKMGWTGTMIGGGTKAGYAFVFTGETWMAPVKADHNGWTNYETWAVWVSLSSDQAECNRWMAKARRLVDNPPASDVFTADEAVRFGLADALKAYHEAQLPDLGGWKADLLNAAMSEVNWSEIAAHMIVEWCQPAESEVV